MRQVLIQNTGAISSGSPAPTHPGGVEAGKIAVFNMDTGALHDPTTAMPTTFQLVQGGAVPINTHLIKKADVFNIKKKAYVAPAKFKRLLVFTEPTESGVFNVKLIQTNRGFDPMPRFNAEVKVTDDTTVATIISTLAAAFNANPNRPFRAYTNKVTSAEIATSSTGTGTLTINGSDYTVTHATNVDGTGAAFVTANAAKILAEQGLVVTYDSSSNKLLFTVYEGGAPSVAKTDGAVTFTLGVETAETGLVIEALNYNDFFEIASDGPVTFSVTNTAFAIGAGSPAQIRELEADAFGAYGELYVQDPLLGQFPHRVSSVLDTSTYIMYSFQVKPNVTENIARDYAIEITIAVNSTVTGSLDTFFGL